VLHCAAGAPSCAITAAHAAHAAHAGEQREGEADSDMLVLKTRRSPMFIEVGRVVRRRWVPVVVMAGAVGLAAAAPAVASPNSLVNCDANSGALQPAITAASPGDTLWVLGTCTGPFTIGQNLTLMGIGHAVLDGNQAGTTVTVDSGARVRLQRLNITNGSIGGINNQGTLTVNESTVSDNTTPFAGGGIFNLNSATLVVSRSTVRNNYSTGAGGGINNNGSLTVRDSRVFGNSADNGGGIANVGIGSTARVIHSAVHNNTARVNEGGGLGNSQGTLTISNSVVYANTAPHGGGIENDTNGTVTLTRSTVERNTALGGPGSGGGIDEAGGTVTLNRSTVRDNSPDNCDPAGSIPGCTG
jgi:hypothetical protein